MELLRKSSISSLCFCIIILLLQLIPLCTCIIDCAKSHLIKGENKLFANCNDLGAQEASIAWSLDMQNRTLEVLFTGKTTAESGWVGWGINPSAPGLQMVGTQAFIAFRAPNGSTLLTYNVTMDTQLGAPLVCSPISLQVLDMAVEISGTQVDIYVSLILPGNGSEGASTTLNHVWNRGSSVSNFRPDPHGLTSDDLSGLKAINMTSGIVSFDAPKPPNYLLKNRHAILNTVGWGILLPGGAIAARYLRFLGGAAWFNAHVTMQIIGYVLGVAGWGTGLYLGNSSVGVIYKKHRLVGIILFSIATLQMMAIIIRPNKDNKIRRHWNLYHYTLGSAILGLGIINIFFGFDILSPQAKWRHAYIGVLGALVGLSIVLEITGWIHTSCKKHSSQGVKDQCVRVKYVAQPQK